MSKPARKLFLCLAALSVVVILGGLGFMIVRQNINEHRCQAALGSGATWAGKDQCFPPPVRVGGLM